MDTKLLEQICTYFVGHPEGGKTGVPEIFQALRVQPGVSAVVLFSTLLEKASKQEVFNGPEAMLAGIALAMGSSDPVMQAHFKEFFEREKRSQGENVVDFKIASSLRAVH